MMNKSILTALIALSLLAFGCGGTEKPSNTAAGNAGSEQAATGTNETAPKTEPEAAGIATPTDAVNTFVEGVRTRDDAKMRSALSKATLEKIDETAKKNKQSFFDVLVGEDYEQMSKPQELRNEKIDGDKATVEIKSDKTGDWDLMPFVKEDGGWKIALFDSDPKQEN